MASHYSGLLGRLFGVREQYARADEPVFVSAGVPLGSYADDGRPVPSFLTRAASPASSAPPIEQEIVDLLHSQNWRPSAPSSTVGRYCLRRRAEFAAVFSGALAKLERIRAGRRPRSLGAAAADEPPSLYQEGRNPPRVRWGAETDGPVPDRWDPYPYLGNPGLSGANPGMRSDAQVFGTRSVPVNLEINEPEIASFAQRVRDIITDRAKAHARIAELEATVEEMSAKLALHEETLRDVQERLART